MNRNDTDFLLDHWQQLAKHQQEVIESLNAVIEAQHVTIMAFMRSDVTPSEKINTEDNE